MLQRIFCSLTNKVIEFLQPDRCRRKFQASWSILLGLVSGNVAVRKEDIFQLELKPLHAFGDKRLVRDLVSSSKPKTQSVGVVNRIFPQPKPQSSLFSEPH